MNIKHSLVVPCYNEEGNVKNFLNEAIAAFKGYTDNYEIVFINDGSSDNTPCVLRKLFEEYKQIKIKVVSFSRNFGKEAAIYAGLLNCKGDYVTIIDADLQQDVKYAVEMGRILDENPDCDIVAAFQQQRKEGGFTAFCKTAFYKVINKLTEVDFIEDASDFRTMRKSVVDTIISLPEYHRFSKGIFSWIGYNTVSMPYEVRERESGETKWSFKKLMKYALDGIISYTDIPLKLPYYSGAFMMVLSVILFVLFIVFDCFNTLADFGAGYICTAVLFVGGILSVCLGFLGSYIGKIHTQVKKRPIFIAKEILTYEND